MTDILILVSEVMPEGGTDIRVQYRVLTMDGNDGDNNVLLSTLGGGIPNSESRNTAILASARAFAAAEWGTAAGNDYLWGGQMLTWPSAGYTGATISLPGYDGLAVTPARADHRHGFAILEVKGDLLVHDGTYPVALAVGSNGQGLVADSTQATGVKWANLPAPDTDNIYVPLFSKGVSNVIGTTSEGAGIAATNIGTSFKYVGLYVPVLLTGYTTIRVVWDAQNGSGQSGTISVEIFDVTSSASRVTGTFTSDARAVGNVSAAIAQTGVHTLAARIKGATSTDDPIFHSIGCTLEK